MAIGELLSSFFFLSSNLPPEERWGKNSTGGEQPLVNNVHHPDTTDLCPDQCVYTVRGFAYTCEHIWAIGGRRGQMETSVDSGDTGCLHLGHRNLSFLQLILGRTYWPFLKTDKWVFVLTWGHFDLQTLLLCWYILIGFLSLVTEKRR